MAEGRPGAPADDVDEERLSQAMAALLGGAWPDSAPGDAAPAPAFTLPPPRRFDDQQPDADSWDEPVLAEASGAAAQESPPPADLWFEPSDSAHVVDPPERPPLDVGAGAGAAEATAAPPPPAAAVGAAGPEQPASVDEPTQAHVWGPLDDVALAPGPAASDAPPVADAPVAFDVPSDAWSLADAPVAFDAPAPPDDWWAAGDDTGPTPVVPPAGADAEADAHAGADADAAHPEPPGLSWPAAGDPWAEGPAGSGPEPQDQAALEEAGLAGPMNTALSDLRRVGGADADPTVLAAPVAAGGYAGSGRMSEFQDWWSHRGRELLPGLAVAAVVVFAFAVVLLGRGSDPESNVETGRVSVSTVPTTVPDLAPSEPTIDESIDTPLFSEPPPPGSETPAAGNSSPAPTTRRPAARAPAPGPRSSGGPTGGSPAPAPPPGPTPTTAPPVTTTPTTEPAPTTTVAPPDPEEDPLRADRCSRPELQHLCD